MNRETNIKDKNDIKNKNVKSTLYDKIDIPIHKIDKFIFGSLGVLFIVLIFSII